MRDDLRRCIRLSFPVSLASTIMLALALVLVANISTRRVITTDLRQATPTLEQPRKRPLSPSASHRITPLKTLRSSLLVRRALEVSSDVSSSGTWNTSRWNPARRYSGRCSRQSWSFGTLLSLHKPWRASFRSTSSWKFHLLLIWK